MCKINIKLVKMARDMITRSLYKLCQILQNNTDRYLKFILINGHREIEMYRLTISRKDHRDTRRLKHALRDKLTLGRSM